MIEDPLKTILRPEISATTQPPDNPPNSSLPTVTLSPQTTEGSESSLPAGYEFLEELGRGGMGVVFKVRHVALDRVVALKMILSGVYTSADGLARFRREATAAAALTHPNIALVYDIGEHAGLPYFTLEFANRGTLKDYAQEPLPPAEAALIVESLAEGIAHAHARGIIHRDLKPDNVLLQSSVDSPTPIMKIADFGLAKTVDGTEELTATGAIIGTPSYMAPEQARGDTATIGRPVDIYALGAIFFRLLTGRPPFIGTSVFDTLKQVQTAVPPRLQQLLPGLPRDLETICEKCLEKDPARRYARAMELANDLRRWRLQEPILARPVGPLERTWKWSRRNRAATAILGTIGLALMVVAIATSLFAYYANRERSATLAALAQVEQARIELKQQLLETESERNRAEKNLTEVERVVEKFSTRVTESQLLRNPGMQDLRRDLLQDAIDHYSRIKNQRGTDTESV
ncbi:MAG: serine/threonine-protein kinase, partial [Gemmataceae bacterium]